MRNRILDLALRIEAEDPRAGEGVGSILSTEQGNVIFNTTVYGGAPNIAMGSSGFVQQALSNPAGSVEELISQLQGLEIPQELLADLRVALDEDSEESQAELSEPGPRVKSWLGRISVLGAKAGGKLGASVTAEVIKLVLAYFGLGGNS